MKEKVDNDELRGLRHLVRDAAKAVLQQECLDKYEAWRARMTKGRVLIRATHTYGNHDPREE